MSYQKLWLIFLPILLINGLFTRGSCLIPYQISLCVTIHYDLPVQVMADGHSSGLISIVCGQGINCWM